jgi:CubicO group peptidase (beta-lactamase class C family)
VSGQSYEAFLKARFFDPLGMKDTGTVLPSALSSRSATGYYDSKGELLAFTDDASYKDPDVTLAFGSGQIYSTVSDLARWDRALLGDKVLPAPQKDLLFAPNLDDYGYGWVIQKRNGVTYEWHNGAISPLGFSAFMVRVPSKDRFVAYLSNIDISRVQPLESKIVELVVR